MLGLNLCIWLGPIDHNMLHGSMPVPSIMKGSSSTATT
jgi:hypothetical protein